MPDLEDRFRRLDRLGVPNLWHEAVARAVEPDGLAPRSLPDLDSGAMSFAVRVTLGAAAVLTVALVGFNLLLASGGDRLGGPAADATPPAMASPSLTDDESSQDSDCLDDGGSLFPNPASEEPPDAGFIGLPPPDAVPSTPESGALVDCYPVHGGLPYEGMVRVYADGRLIWLSYYDDPDSVSADNSRSTGFLEQRLTPQGVQLVIDRDDVSEKHPLRLAEWMPASGWEDQTIRSYVPSGYAACLVVENWEDPFQKLTLTLAEKLAILPSAAADFLRDREAVPSDAYDSSFDCLGMTTAEARQLDATLRDAELEQDERRNRFLLEYHVDFDGPAPDAWHLGIWFEPILPDGIITCTSCG